MPRISVNLSDMVFSRLQSEVEYLGEPADLIIDRALNDWFAQGTSGGEDTLG
ncbi:MAG: hypothetical protein ACM3QZ_11725 [Solirubrobacterales bacterium]